MGLWIRSLEVANFAGIESAALDFAPGLNICHGPNELGKSTLVKAIRCALLLQDSSTAAEELVDWHADAPPAVNLVFETEPQRIWRVRKCFSAGRERYSYLEFSRDGSTFTQEALGREVDGRLAELLQWGIEAPGGRSRRRGIPEPFIATALIGDQAAVTEILNKSIEDDPDKSGEQRLRSALQAIAEDPLFHMVLERTQTKVDEAFTATGRHKSGRSSPWIEVRNQIQAALERSRQVEAQRTESDSTRLRIDTLHRDLMSAQADKKDSEQRMHTLQSEFQRQHERRQAKARLDEAVAELSRIESLKQAVAHSWLTLEQKREELAARSVDQDAADERAKETALDAEAALARLREHETGAAEQQRRLREQELEKTRLELNSKRTNLKNRTQQAEQIRATTARVGALQTEIEKSESTLEKARALLAAAREASDNDDTLLETLTLKLIGARCIMANARVAEIEAERSASVRHRDTAKRLEADANRLRDEAADLNAPEPATLIGLRSLATELRVAEEKLQVGLSVSVTPAAKLELEVSVDDGDPKKQRIGQSGHHLEARGQLRIDVPDVATFVVRSGSRELQVAAADARKRWNSEAGPWLEAAGCTTIAELETLGAQAQAKLAESQSLAAQAETTLARASAGETDDKAHADAVRLAERLDTALREGFADETQCRVFLDELAGGTPREDEIERDIGKTNNEVASRRQLARALEAQVSKDEGRLEGFGRELAALETELDAMIQAFAGDWQSLLGSAPEARRALDNSLAEIEEQIVSVQSEATVEVDAARIALEASRAAHKQASQVSESMEKSVSAIRTAVAHLQGELGVRQKAADAEDEAAALALVARATAELEALTAPVEIVQEQQLEGSRAAYTGAVSEVRRLELELRQAEGALQQVGGQYVEEQAEQAQDALNAAREREHELEIDYGAWDLLRRTLRDAEDESAVHLGNALVEPVSQRMSTLTGGRYTSVAIEPRLRTGGVEIGGETRSYDALSLGTREQLATMLRLAIAEALDSFIVMDDQLTQSDPGRMATIREMLRAAAEQIQVVVFTCRPEDYVTKGFDVERQLDLQACVKRRPVSNLNGLPCRSHN